MARPIKDGVDYFPLDVVCDRKFKLIEAKFGIVGFGIIVRLYQCIYAEYGYYYPWDADTALITAADGSCSKHPLTAEDVQAVVDEAVSRDIFDRQLYEKYAILTSRGVQRRYFEAVKRRSRICVDKRYLLIDLHELPVNVSINGVSVDKMNTETKKIQTEVHKVNKSKVNKSIVNNNKPGADKSAPEQEQSEQEEPPIISLPLNTGSVHGVTQSDIDRKTGTKTKNNTPSNSPKQKQRKLDDVLAEVENDVLREALKEFVAMRKQIKKPLTVYALELSIKKLYGMSADITERTKIVEQTVMNSWQSFYPLNDNDAKTYLGSFTKGEKSNGANRTGAVIDDYSSVGW